MAARLAKERCHDSLVLALFLLLFTALPIDGPEPESTSETDERGVSCLSRGCRLGDGAGGKPVSLAVDADKFKVSIHGSILACVDCHADVKSSPHEARPAKVDCSTCHAEQQSAYDRSYHAKAIKAGNLKAATCVDCHGGPHELLAASDPKARVNHANLAVTCGSCHGQKFVMEASGQSAQPYLLTSRVSRMDGRSPQVPKKLRCAPIAMDHTKFCKPAMLNRPSSNSMFRRHVRSVTKTLNKIHAKHPWASCRPGKWTSSGLY